MKLAVFTNHHLQTKSFWYVQHYRTTPPLGYDARHSSIELKLRHQCLLVEFEYGKLSAHGQSRTQ
jgi:hypothetical protein